MVRSILIECYGKERYDAGTETRDPDLIRSALELLEQIWKKKESVFLLTKY